MLQRLVVLLVIKPSLPVNPPDSWREVDICSMVFTSICDACWPATVSQTSASCRVSFKAVMCLLIASDERCA